MTLPSLYLSRPAIVMPETALDNEAVLSLLRESFLGSAFEWAPIEQGIQYVFDRFNTKL